LSLLGEFQAEHNTPAGKVNLRLDISAPHYDFIADAAFVACEGACKSPI
jgi:hypothetical protein